MRTGLCEKASAEMAEMLGKEGNFAEMTAAIDKYARWPAAKEKCDESLDMARTKLKEHWGKVLEDAKAALLKLMDETTDTLKIDEELKKYVDYGTHISHERDALTERRNVLIQHAASEMFALAAAQEPNLPEIDVWLKEKYLKYPEEPNLRAARDQLLVTRTTLVTTARDELVAGTRLTSIEDVSALLEKHKDAATEELVSKAAEDMQALKTKLVEDFRGVLALALRSVLGSWVGVRHIFHLSVFLTASRMVLPKILLVLTARRL